MIVSQGHQVSPDSGVVHDVNPLAVSRIVKYFAAEFDVGSPNGLPPGVRSLKKLPSSALSNPVLRYSCQRNTVVAEVRRGTVLRVGVNETVARARVVSSEIKK